MSGYFSTQRREGAKPQSKKKEARQSRYAAANAEWNKRRPDLRHSPNELREERLKFSSQVLGIGPIGSLGDLTIPQLDRVIEAMKNGYQPGLISDCRLAIADFNRGQSDNRQSPIANRKSAEVVHLASAEQVWAIEQTLEYLRNVWGWSKEGGEGFLRKNYRRPSGHMLSPRQAGGALTILLSIAAKKEITRRLGNDVKVSRAMIRAEMPSLKVKIGIDRKAKAARAAECSTGNNQ